jgi:REP element-mobilizing transposase RayT
MSRPLRIDYPGAWHHVMNRARRGHVLYQDNEDHELFLSLLRETAAMFHMNVAAYCLMPNHYHVLVQTEDGNLSRCMRHVNGVYTQKYNIRYKTDGTLFRGRYKSVLVQADSHLLQLIRYIHKNPVKAGMAENLADFRWSSHAGYVSGKREWAWLHTDFILSMLTQDKKQQDIQYKSFMGMPDSEEIEVFYAKKNLSSILGEKTFIHWVKEIFFQEKKDQDVPDSKRLAPDIDQINCVVANIYGIDKDRLFKAKRGVENEPRNVAIYITRHLKGEPLNKIGEAFNLNRDSSVSSAIERVRNRIEKDRAFRKRINAIKEVFYKGQTET